jgi:hypothetical protein
MWIEVNYDSVKQLRQLAGLLVLGLTLGWPLMACLVAGAEMSAAERECCKQMAKRCGSMDMPSSHSCCQTEVRQAGPMLHVEQASVTPQFVAATTVSVPAITAIDSFQILSTDRHPPPESPPSSSSIIRI